jgi:hypothetical protein
MNNNHEIENNNNCNEVVKGIEECVYVSNAVCLFVLTVECDCLILDHFISPPQLSHLPYYYHLILYMKIKYILTVTTVTLCMYHCIKYQIRILV